MIYNYQINLRWYAENYMHNRLENIEKRDEIQGSLTRT